MPEHRYTTEQVERALRALVLADSNIKLAKRRLEADGLTIPERTLRDWRTEHAARIAALHEQRDWVTKGQAEDFEGLTSELTTAAQDALGKLAEREDWDDMNIASLGKYVQSLITSAAIATDKGRLLRDQPTVITESRDLASLLKQLQSPKFAGVVSINESLINGSATEIVDQKEIEEAK